jgi:hypothetical protein
MNLDTLQRKLLAAARAERPGDRVPYAFEKRILARIAGLPPEDGLALWAGALWRALAPCAAVALALGLWTWMTPAAGTSIADLDSHLENTVLASIPLEPDTSW